MTADPMTDTMEALVDLALELGASAAAVVPTSAIVVDDRLARLCEPPGCPNYGLGAGCPPHVDGPAAFRQKLSLFKKAIVYKIDAPRAMLLDDTRQALFVALHRLAVDIEAAAIANGFENAAAYAGGSCKALFCADDPDCPVIENRGACRWPDRARHSMSGYGIDVFRSDEVGRLAGRCSGHRSHARWRPLERHCGSGTCLVSSAAQQCSDSHFCVIKNPVAKSDLAIHCQQLMVYI